MMIVGILAGATRRAEAADKIDEHYQRAEQHNFIVELTQSLLLVLQVPLAEMQLQTLPMSTKYVLLWLMIIVGMLAGAIRRGEAADSADEHYQQAKQHASASAGRAGDALDEATTSAARR